MDAHHVLLHFVNEVDFLRVWARGIWQIGNFPMRVFPWTLEYHVHRGTCLDISAITVNYLFDKHSLFSIVSVVGRTLYVDATITSLVWLSVACVCVEVDLLHPIPQRMGRYVW